MLASSQDSAAAVSLSVVLADMSKYERKLFKSNLRYIARTTTALNQLVTERD